MKVNNPKRFLSIRLTPAELQEVYKQLKSTTCRSLTEYVRKVVTRKPVIVKFRNQSADELLLIMIDIKNSLEKIAEQSDEQVKQKLLPEIEEIKAFTRQLYEKWSRS